MKLSTYIMWIILFTSIYITDSDLVNSILNIMIYTHTHTQSHSVSEFGRKILSILNINFPPLPKPISLSWLLLQECFEYCTLWLCLSVFIFNLQNPIPFTCHIWYLNACNFQFLLIYLCLSIEQFYISSLSNLQTTPIYFQLIR